MGPEIVELLGQTVREPRAAARRILSMQLASGTVWKSFALVVVLSAVAGWLTLAVMPAETAPMMPGQASPLSLAVVQGLSTLLLAGGVAFGGRIFGGRGAFAGALVLVVWLEFLLVCLQALQFFLMLVLPTLSTLVGFVAVGLFLWILTNFVAELHGFKSLGKVFAGIVGGFLVAGLLILALFGPLVPVGGM